MKKILILASNPDKDLDLDYEIHALKNIVEDSENLQEFDVIIDDAISPGKIQRLFHEHEPRIVHFCGHGSGEDGLVFIDSAGEKQQVSTEALSNLFQEFDDTVECVLLNACYSEVQANAIANHINYAIGMNQAINDDAAIFFAKGFYQALGSGKKIQQCFRLGKNAIELELSKLSGQPRKFEALDDEEYSPIPEHLKPTIKIKSELTFFPEDIARQEYIRQNQNDFDLGQRQQTNLSKKEDRFRQILLNKVRDSWIKGVLENSLHTKALLELEITRRPDLVHNPFSEYKELPVDPNSSYEWLQAKDVFEQMRDGRTLLILGEPGSGKTIALLKLAKRFIEKAENNLSLPIPVVFNLSSWATKRKPIAEWLIMELKEKYQVSKSLAKQWIEQDQLLLLLDGLDEVKQEHRNDCAKAINEFLNSHGLTEIVVCSRFQEYESLAEKLKLRSAIYIQSLTAEHIDWYLKDTGDLFSGLKTLLRSDSEMEEFAKTPLILNIMSLTYQNVPPEKILQELRSPENRYQKLFDSYIERMFYRTSNVKKSYGKGKSIKWLKLIAEQMTLENQSIFLIENIQPTLIKSETGSNAQKWIYHIGVMFIVYLLVGLLFIPTIFDIGLKDKFEFLDRLIFIPLAWLCCGLISSLVYILIYQWLKIKLNSTKISRSNSEMCNKPRSINKFIINSLINGILSGLITAFIYGRFIYFFIEPGAQYSWISISLFIYPLFLTILAFILENINSEILEIKPVQVLEASSKKIMLNLFFAIVFVLLFSVIYQIRNFIVWYSLDWNSLGKLMLPLIAIGLCFTIFNGFELPTNIKEKSTKPNQGIWDSAKNVLPYMMIVMPIGAVIGFVWATQTKFVNRYTALMYGMALGLIGSIVIFGQGSGIVLIKHFILRVLLCFNQLIPWNYSHFLEYATDLIFLQKVGGGYQFIHRMLREHFAQRN